MDLIKALIALISSIVLSLGGHGAVGKPRVTPAPSQVEIRVSEPTESGCPQEGHIKSPSSYNKASITFDNQTGGDVKVYWLDFTGKRKLYSNLKAHTKYDQATWVGHVWVVADGADICVKLHSANAVQQTLVIN